MTTNHQDTKARSIRQWAGRVLPLCLLALLSIACSHINEDERLIYVKMEPAKRVVLLEDFTGQRCLNCPLGTDVINQLLEEYGDHLVPVGIHGGPLGFAGNGEVKGLATDVGNEYYNHWQLEYQPVGLVNRHGAVNYTDWTARVKEAMAETAPIELTTSAFIEGSQVHITIKATGTEGTTTGMLQVWLLEDGITALQMMPDHSTNSNYVHNHVLRTPVNGTWGQDFSIREGEMQTFDMTQALNSEWDADQLTIVAFVYNDQGVQQASKAHVLKAKE